MKLLFAPPIAPLALLLVLAGCGLAHAAPQQAVPPDAAFPDAGREAKTWSYWWWMGNAVDKESIATLLDHYAAAGLGGLHIVPIYGVEGEEKNYLEFLSPDWMDMLAYTVAEADKRGLGIDMSTNTGWPFGGPWVTKEMAAKRLVIEREDGELSAAWEPTGQQVKRAAPGGEGLVLDPFSPEALKKYLARFDEAFANYGGKKPRAQYHDSYEYYNANYTSGFLEAFQQRRGYDLTAHLEALQEGAPAIRRDYRRTLAELHRKYIEVWAAWAHGHGFKTRNQAHGAPGNLLDLYAAADIPETEIFGPSGFDIPGLRTDPDFPRQDGPDPLMAKFASSAAHVMGKPLVSSETCTWLGEHFRTALSQCKPEMDQLFAAGINHIFYHGIAYSPPGAPWPGWQFYAATSFAPTNPFFRDFPALNAYAARVQAVLQAGAPDNDLLVYFPYEDILASEGDLLKQLTVHNLAWHDIGGLRNIMEYLWEHGYTFDLVSDAQLQQCTAETGGIHTPGGAVYEAVLVPDCEYMPEHTGQRLRDLANGGAALLRVADGLEGVIEEVGIKPEPIAEAGIRLIRRQLADGHYYFFTNLAAQPFDGWAGLATAFRAATLLDPMHAGRVGRAAVAPRDGGRTWCYLQLAPGQSLVLRTFSNRVPNTAPWPYAHAGEPVPLEGPWQVAFLEGGPELPDPVTVEALASWTTFGGGAYKDFSGTARYETTITKPAGNANGWRLDLGNVGESARVFVNGEEAGVLFAHPFHLAIGDALVDGENTLAIEVTNLGANRIAHLDREGVNWKKFHDINFVNIQYKGFDASGWEPMPSGLMGPVALVPLTTFTPEPPG
ncbi:MAG: glycosyl hydrolase [Candidatus Hydrogenedentota bacterium]